MWNMNDEGTTKGLKVEKNRQGELGHVALSFDGAKMTFDTINHKSFEQTQKDCQGFKGSDNPFG